MRSALLATALIAVSVTAWLILAPPVALSPSMPDVSETDSTVSEQIPEADITTAPVPENDARPADSATDGIDSQGDDELEPEYTTARDSFLNRRRLEIERIKTEPVDPDWAPEMAQLVRSEIEATLSANPELRERYSIAGVDCRTSACELTIFSFDPTAEHNDVDLSNAVRTLYADSWFEYFEGGWWGVSTTDNGLYEDRQYFNRRTTEIDYEAVERYRIPVLSPEATGE